MNSSTVPDDKNDNQISDESQCFSKHKNHDADRSKNQSSNNMSANEGMSIFPQKCTNVQILNPMAKSYFDHNLPSIDPNISFISSEMPAQSRSVDPDPRQMFTLLFQQLRKECTVLKYENNPNQKQENPPQQKTKNSKNNLILKPSFAKIRQKFHQKDESNKSSQQEIPKDKYQKKQDQLTKFKGNSNCIKNFMLSFYKMITHQQKLSSLLEEQKYGFLRNSSDQRKMLKNIKDNLSKKVKYSGKNRRQKHIEQMLQHKNLQIRSMLIQECFKYLKDYPSVARKKQSKVTDQEKNEELKKIVYGVIQKIDPQLFLEMRNQ